MNKFRGDMVAKQKIFRLRTALLLVMLLATSVSLSLVWGAPERISVSALGGLTDRRPVGTSIEGWWSTPPQGYLLEDGSAVSRTTYAALFSVIGTTFGVGDGSTTFNLPDSRGKVIVAKSSDTEFNVLGETGGEKTHDLTVTEMPAHDHDFWAQTIAWGGVASVVWFRQLGGEQQPIVASAGATNCGSDQPCGSTWMYTQSGANGWTDTYDSGGGGAHNNLQPYITLNRAIKY